MKFMLSLLALAAVVSAGPSVLPVNPGGIGGLFKGPSGETIIKGPDGSVITSAAEGGEVHTKIDPIIVEEPHVENVPEVVPLEPAPVAISGRVDTVQIEGADTNSKQKSDLQGPSGRIITDGSKSIVAGPASTTISGPGGVAETVVKNTAIIASPAPVLSADLGQIATVTAAPISVSSGIAVTASPISVSTAPLLGSTLEVASVNSGLVGNLPVAAETLPIAVTSVPQAPGLVTATPPPQNIISTASTIDLGPLITVTPPPSLSTVSIESISATPSPLPVVSSTPLPITNGLSSGLTINDQINLDSRQLLLNPALIPANNIIPPEIGLGQKRPQLLTTPGLGAVGTNIQRVEGDIGLSTVAPNIIEANGRLGSLDQQLAIQNQQNALINQQTAVQNGVVDITPRNNILLKQDGLPTIAGLQQQALARPNLEANNLLVQGLRQQNLGANIQQQEVLAGNVVANLGALQQQEVLGQSGGPVLKTITVQQEGAAPTLANIQQQELLRQNGNLQQQELLRQNVNLQQQELLQQNVNLQQQELLRQNGNLQQQELLQQNVNIQQQQEWRPTEKVVITQAARQGLFNPNPGPSLASIQQQNQLNDQLLKSGVEQGQIQLVNVRPLPSGLNDGLGQEAWGRPGRAVPKSTKKE